MTIEREITCPYCDKDIDVLNDKQELICPHCGKNLILYDWHECCWKNSTVERNLPLFYRSEKKLLHEPLILDRNNENRIELEIELPDKFSTITVAVIYRHDNRWFLTSETNDSIKLNGKTIHKHTELDVGDSISAYGYDMHFAADNKIVSGKIDFGIKSLELKNISAQLGEKTLAAENINIHAGEFVGILGPSGCGKSSLLEIMVGLRSDFQGDYLINGIDYQAEFAGKKIAYVPQEIVFHKNLTLNEEISCYNQINMHNQIQQERIDFLLRRIGLEKQKDNTVGKLSGGQRRKAGFVMEVLRDPAILFLDEPTAGLDPNSESEVMHDLKSLAAQGRIVICSTHIMDNIKLFDKVIFISENAQLQFVGSPDEMFAKYGIKNAAEIYEIKTDPPNHKSEKSHKSSRRRKNPVNIADWGVNKSEVRGYLKRMWLEISKIDFKEIRKSFLNFLLSPISVLLIQPIVIAVVLQFACAEEMEDFDKKLGFFFSVAVFWLGMNNSIKELVKERIPIRCLERLRKVKLGSYISAKILWMLFLCFVQVFLFFITLLLGAYMVDKVDFLLSWKFPFILFLVCCSGGLVGLAVSAFNKKDEEAIAFLPMSIIPVLFFSQPIIGNDDYEYFVFKKEDTSGEKSSNQISWEYLKEYAIHVEHIMPCYSSMVLMQQVIENDDNRKCNILDNENASCNCEICREKTAWKFMLKQQFYYWIICFMIIILGQNKREKEWEGR